MIKTRSIRIETVGHDLFHTVTNGLAMHLPSCRVCPDGEGICRSVMTGDGLSVTTELIFPEGRGTGTVSFGGEALSRLFSLTPEKEYLRLARYLVGASLWKAVCALTGENSPWGSLAGVRPGKIGARVLSCFPVEADARAVLTQVYGLDARTARICTDAGLAEIKLKNSLSARDSALYVGIPYCPTVCRYCSFVSRAAGGKQLKAYFEALLTELRALGEGFSRGGRRLRDVYVGGGTPTVLSAAQLALLLSTLRECFDLSACREITVEAGRPDTVTEEKLRALQAAGTTRICINTQSLQDDVLARIGRRHSADQYREALCLAQSIGDWDINTDLIAGLSGETTEQFAAGLSEIIRRGVPQITVHSLAMKNASRMTEDGEDFNPAQPEMLKIAAEILYGAGYKPYYLYRQKYSGGGENVGWLKNSKVNEYNILMMEELCTVFAVGAGGVSKILRPDGLDRISNPKYPDEYIARIDRIAEEKRRPFPIHEVTDND